MLFSSASVPVSIEPAISDYMQGTISIDGLLSYQDRMLTLEYRLTSLEMEQTAVRTLELASTDLRDIALNKGFVGAKIVLRPQRLALCEQVPGVADGALKVKRRDREEAATLVSHVRLELSEARLGEG